MRPPAAREKDPGCVPKIGPPDGNEVRSRQQWRADACDIGQNRIRFGKDNGLPAAAAEREVGHSALGDRSAHDLDHKFFSFLLDLEQAGGKMKGYVCIQTDVGSRMGIRSVRVNCTPSGRFWICPWPRTSNSSVVKTKSYSTKPSSTSRVSN